MVTVTEIPIHTDLYILIREKSGDLAEFEKNADGESLHPTQ